MELQSFKLTIYILYTALRSKFSGTSIDGHAARGPLARPAARHFGPARARAATVARGTAQARPDVYVPVKNIAF